MQNEYSDAFLGEKEEKEHLIEVGKPKSITKT